MYDDLMKRRWVDKAVYSKGGQTDGRVEQNEAIQLRRREFC